MLGSALIEYCKLLVPCYHAGEIGVTLNFVLSPVTKTSCWVISWDNRNAPSWEATPLIQILKDWVTENHLHARINEFLDLQDYSTNIRLEFEELPKDG